MIHVSPTHIGANKLNLKNLHLKKLGLAFVCAAVLGVGNLSMAKAASESTSAYQAAMDAMMQSMMVSATGAADADFLKGMIPHHKGAVAMAQVELKYGKDETMRKLATDIIAAQNSEIAFMQKWLKGQKLKSLKTSSVAKAAAAKPMENMMADMAITYSGNADTDFARGMVPHHQGAIGMAKVVLKFGKNAEIKKLAEGVVGAQTSEIALMNDWLTKHPAK